MWGPSDFEAAPWLCWLNSDDKLFFALALKSGPGRFGPPPRPGPPGSLGGAPLPGARGGFDLLPPPGLGDGLRSTMGAGPATTPRGKGSGRDFCSDGFNGRSVFECFLSSSSAMAHLQAALLWESSSLKDGRLNVYAFVKVSTPSRGIRFEDLSVQGIDRVTWVFRFVEVFPTFRWWKKVRERFSGFQSSACRAPESIL